LAWLFGLLPVLVVLGVMAGYWAFEREAQVNRGVGATPAQTTHEPQRLRVGRDYYVFVKTIELYPRRPGDKAWDRFGGSAPDIRYHLAWQDLVVYTSPVREDTLIGVWDPINVDVRSALPMLGEGKIELASTLNQGAIVHVEPETTLTINVWDQDPTGLGSDAAGQVVLRLDELVEGDNALTFDASQHNGIKRLVLGTTDTSEPVKNLLEALQAP
jgi:hypothetical protein